MVISLESLSAMRQLIELPLVTAQPPRLAAPKSAKLAMNSHKKVSAPQTCGTRAQAPVS